MAVTIKRDAFCLGCGDLFRGVEVSYDPYRPPPPAEVPTWCRKPACKQARERFNQTCDEIRRTL